MKDWILDVLSFPVFIALFLYFISLFLIENYRGRLSPIYFSIYPLTLLNYPLSKYLGHNQFESYIDDTFAEKEKKLFIMRSTFISVLYMIGFPFCLLLIWRQILTSDQLHFSLVIVIMATTMRFGKTLFRLHVYPGVAHQLYFIVIHFMVTGIIIYFFLRAHFWIDLIDQTRNYLQLVISSKILIDVFMTGLIIALTPCVIMLTFKKNLRKANLK